MMERFFLFLMILSSVGCFRNSVALSRVSAPVHQATHEAPTEMPPDIDEAVRAMEQRMVCFEAQQKLATGSNLWIALEELEVACGSEELRIFGEATWTEYEYHQPLIAMRLARWADKESEVDRIQASVLRDVVIYVEDTSIRAEGQPKDPLIAVNTVPADLDYNLRATVEIWLTFFGAKITHNQSEANFIVTTTVTWYQGGDPTKDLLLQSGQLCPIIALVYQVGAGDRVVGQVRDEGLYIDCAFYGNLLPDLVNLIFKNK